MRLDEKDCKILNFLQEDCRMSYTEMADRLEVSVDTVKNRFERLLNNKVFEAKVQIKPRTFGYSHIVDVKIKLHNYDDERLSSFIEFLTKHPRVTELFSISGEWNFTAVLIAKDHEDLARITNEIRQNFPEIINEWSESLTTFAYKFEKYNMLRLTNIKDKNLGSDIR